MRDRRHGKVGHIFGANCVPHAVVSYLRIAQDTYDSHDTEAKVGHIFGADCATLVALTYDSHDTEAKVRHHTS